jgi:hypothetical protein
MGKNKMTDLQDHLFLTIEMLRTGELKPEVAREINNVGRTLLDSAKVEMKYMETLGLSKASTPLLASIGTEPVKQLPEPVITYSCANRHCTWEGKQKEKELLKDGDEERRICPLCKKDEFLMLINGRQEPKHPTA